MVNDQSYCKLASLRTRVGATKGIVFEMTTGISGTEKATLGPDTTAQTTVLNYVRGDQSNEGASPKFRTRTYTLGDITNSKPVEQAAPSLPYAGAPLNPGYSTFKSTRSTRSPVVYVGATDGMLHAFDGSMTSATGGKALFAYVANFLFNINIDIASNPVGLASLVSGYYIDLADYPSSQGLQASAERVNVQPVASGGVVSFAANLSGQDPCCVGGSRPFALSCDSGSIGKSFLTDSSGTPVVASINPSPGVVTSFSIVTTGTGLKVLAGLSTGSVNGFSLKGLLPSLQKLNWREAPAH